METIDLLECLVEYFYFGQMDNENYNADLIVFTHPQYLVDEAKDQFICFEINNN